MHSDQATQINQQMTIRRMDLTDADRAAVDRLADRDTHEPIAGPILGAEVEGRLLAAVSLADGTAIADPFSRTTELLALLRLRAEQIRDRRSVRRHRDHNRRTTRGRTAVGGSPAGQILSLPRWG